MKPTLWKTLSTLLIALFVVLFAIGLVGECGGMLETTTGSMVPMKCHWAFVAACLMAPLGAIAGLCAMLSLQASARRIALTMAVATAAAVILVLSPLGIGVCASDGMACQGSAYAAWSVAGVALVLACILLAKADPQVADKPKRSL